MNKQDDLAEDERIFHEVRAEFLAENPELDPAEVDAWYGQMEAKHIAEVLAANDESSRVSGKHKSRGRR